MPKVYFAKDNMCTTKKLEVKKVYDYFVANGWGVTMDMDQADIIFCPTCVGWKIKEEKSLERLRQANKYGKTIVCYGCLNNFNPAAVAEAHKGICIPAQKLENVTSLIKNPKVAFCDIAEPST